MQSNVLKTWLNSSYLFSGNQNWIEQLYEDFLINPNLVDPSWCSIFQKFPSMEIELDRLHSKTRDYFRRLTMNSFLRHHPNYDFSVSSSNICLKQVKVFQLIEAYRYFGYRHANLDPLGMLSKEYIENLDPGYYGFVESDYQERFSVGFFSVENSMMKLSDLIRVLKQTYCSSIGAEYMHIASVQEKNWIQQRIEPTRGHVFFSETEKKRLLSELTAAEGLEQYLGTRFPGAKRFSLEGAEVFVPMLKEIIRYSGKNNICEILLGMAHRGRLNVLINVLGKKPKDIFDEFLEKKRQSFGSGDVKYHMGFTSDIRTDGNVVRTILAFNPSHLEIVSPVVMGCARARVDQLYNKKINGILPITVHGDSAIIGQGVTQETLNMSKVRGYEVGGTVRVVINNQIGFTTSNLLDVRSTLYCTDIAKMIQAPIFHVNGDDPEAVVFIARLALDFRNTFNRDVFIDLVCYRRHGHNEADEPSVTQPLMYKIIKKHETLRKIYADKLEREQIITLEDALALINSYRNVLDIGECVVKELCQPNTDAFVLSSSFNKEGEENYSSEVEIEYLQELAKRISVIPEAIKMQSRVEKIYTDRKRMALGQKPFDWGGAENLAYATLVDKGISVRLSGEDSGRGTFFHRHAVIHNQIDGDTYIPLQHIHDIQGEFNVWDSVLSEEAVLAFEYGYAMEKSKTLTIWEAQFGDFANGAQVVIDQFISSGEQKWGQMCGLVLLLPHGYEGQGPEHSSARLERYLQLCAENNMQVCIPSTPAQSYHMLRRQALRNIRRPLIVMSPKSLLRHPLAVSSLQELASGTFLPVIGEVDALDPKFVKRVIICSGKIYYDLLEQRRKNNQKNVAIVRIEQLYPFPKQEIQDVIKPYVHVRNFVWCQEEPINQGAWNYGQLNFKKVIPDGGSLYYIGRAASAAPATGYMFIHRMQQVDLVNNALNVN